MESFNSALPPAKRFNFQIPADRERLRLRLRLGASFSDWVFLFVLYCSSVWPPDVRSLIGVRVRPVQIEYRQNLDLTKVGTQIVSGVVQNARKWVSVGVIKFPVR